MAKDKMTIEKLATMVAEGFSGIEERMATKDDIANMATKDDLKNLATKDDLADLERRLSNKIEVIDEKIDILEEVDVRDLQKRVYGLEKDVKQLKQLKQSKHV